MQPNPNTLPQPSAEELSRSQALSHSIQKHIQTNGPISFAKFMAQALYTPKLGYYENSHIFGAAGDFITAAHCGPWLSQMLAKQVMQIAKTLPNYNLAEFGAGDGHMALALLQTLQQANILPQHYYIIEKSEHLKTVQQQTLAAHPDLLKKIKWVNKMPLAFEGIIFANEVLDAMPFYRFKKISDNQYQECFIDIGEQGLVETWQPTQNNVPAAIKNLRLDEEHHFEVNPQIQSWLQDIFDHCEQAICLLIDYGTEEHSFFSRAKTGYARAFYKHRVHDNLLQWPGLQDLTTHVNFTEVAQTAVDLGWELEGYTTQANFLIDCGISNIELSPYDSEEGILARAQIKKLCLPQDMGEMFKVLALSKHNTLDLIGFEHDTTERL